MNHMKNYDYQPGASLKMWRDFFTNANIYSIDINRDALFTEERINTYLCSQIDQIKINELFKNKKFNFILDDGSHLLEHQIKSLNIFLDYLENDGIYIIEDVKEDLFNKENLIKYLGNTDILNKIKIEEYNLRKGFNRSNFFYLITKK